MQQVALSHKLPQCWTFTWGFKPSIIVYAEVTFHSFSILDKDITCANIWNIFKQQIFNLKMFTTVKMLVK